MYLGKQYSSLHPQESALELPNELKQLKQMRSERQEWAKDHYRLTEQGLLAPISQAQSAPKASTKSLPASEGQTESVRPAAVDSAPSDPQWIEEMQAPHSREVMLQASLPKNWQKTHLVWEQTS